MQRPFKEEMTRAWLNHLGFDLERAGTEYIVQDRREHRDMPALPPTRCQSLHSIIDLFQIEL
jgi:hypothetical protein